MDSIAPTHAPVVAKTESLFRDDAAALAERHAFYRERARLRRAHAARARRSAAGHVGAGELVARLLRGARGGVVTGRLIETALRGLGAPPSPGVLRDAVRQARRRHLRPGETIERARGLGYLMTATGAAEGGL